MLHGGEVEGGALPEVWHACMSCMQSDEGKSIPKERRGEEQACDGAPTWCGHVAACVAQQHVHVPSDCACMHATSCMCMSRPIVHACPVRLTVMQAPPA
eukprot:353783-Chlamydomonas_euryale.AAC.8